MYVLLGANGQITSQLASQLLADGLPVRVIGRSAATMAPLAAAGAQLAVGDPGDARFLAQAFEGATAAYTMIPPCYAEPDMHAAQDRIGAAIAQALAMSRVPRVVNLSSIGAELASGTGPIEALHAQEARLNALPGLALLHLRPGSFMENFLPLAGVVATAGVLPGMEAPDVPLPLVATRDVAATAARALLSPELQGVQVLHAPRHVTMREAAAILGAAVGRPALPYVQSDPAAGQAQLRAQGMSASAAAKIAALAHWLSTTALESVTAAPAVVQPTTLERFAAEVFAPACAAASRAG